MIIIEGLVPREPNQEKNSTPSKRYRFNNGTTDILSSQGGKRDRRASRAQSIFLAGLTTFSPLLAACGERQVSAGTSPSVQEATAEAFAEQNPDVSAVNTGVDKVGISTPEPASTAEPQKPTPSPEAKLIGNGAIMPAELSTTGVFVDFEYQGQVYKLALYNLPDGTPITAPKDGYFVTGNSPTPFIGSSLSIFNPVDLTIPNISLRGSLKPVNRLSRNVKAGEIVAYIQDTGDKMFGENNFAVRVTAQNSTDTGFFSPEAPYKEYLPDLPKGPRIVQTQTIQSSSGNVYLPKEK